MPDNLTHLHRETGCIWDLTAALYERDEARDIERLRAGWTSILPAEEPLLRQYLPCGRALHLQCAGGVDTLSLWKLGARMGAYAGSAEIGASAASGCSAPPAGPQRPPVPARGPSAGLGVGPGG